MITSLKELYSRLEPIVEDISENDGTELLAMKATLRGMCSVLHIPSLIVEFMKVNMKFIEAWVGPLFDKEEE